MANRPSMYGDMLSKSIEAKEAVLKRLDLIIEQSKDGAKPNLGSFFYPGLQTDSTALNKLHSAKSQQTAATTTWSKKQVETLDIPIIMVSAFISAIINGFSWTGPCLNAGSCTLSGQRRTRSSSLSAWSPRASRR